MWLDNASKTDILFYKPYAVTIANTISEIENTPLTVGLFGKWGAGKSTLLNLIKEALSTDEHNSLVIEINAWLFEGYTDAKTSLMDIIATELMKEQNLPETIKEKAKKLWARVNKIKLAKAVLTIGGSVASIITKNPTPGIAAAGVAASIGDSEDSGKKPTNPTADTIKAVSEGLDDEIIKDNDATTNLLEFRKEFNELIKGLGTKTVVFVIDDLDRCTPERIIDTLEAIKLFLSVENTVFLIAADESIIKYAIGQKYPELREKNKNYAQEYIEKIIQLPITVPALSEKDVMNYLLLLVAQSHLKERHFNDLLMTVISEKYHTRSTPITYQEMLLLVGKLSEQPYRNLGHGKEELEKDLKIIDNIKEIIAHTLDGNPRQAKRFLNSFVMKKALAEQYYPGEIDTAVLAKLMTLYYIKPELFHQLYEWNSKYDGTIPNLQEALDPTKSDQYPEWKNESVQKWGYCAPVELHTIPLDNYFYLTREHLQDINIQSTLTAEAKKILSRMLRASAGTIEGVFDDLKKLPTVQIEIIIGNIISKMSGSNPNDWLYALQLYDRFPDKQEMLWAHIKTMTITMSAVTFFKHLYIQRKDLFEEIYDNAGSKDRKILDKAKG